MKVSVGRGVDVGVHVNDGDSVGPGGVLDGYGPGDGGMVGG